MTKILRPGDLPSLCQPLPERIEVKQEVSPDITQEWIEMYDRMLASTAKARFQLDPAFRRLVEELEKRRYPDVRNQQ